MKLEKFMFCMTLETIGLTIGFFGVFIWGGSILLLIGILLYPLLILKSDDFKEQQYIEEILAHVPLPIFFYIFAIIVATALIYIHILLIKGIRKNQHTKMIPWLVLNCLIIFCAHVFNVVAILFLLDNLNRLKSILIAFIIAVEIIQIYCFVAVYRLYENIRETSQHGLVTNKQTAGFLMPTTKNIPETV